MADAFICDGIRTPIGRFAGALAPVRTDDLAAIPIAALIARNPGVDWAAVDDLYMGCANQAGEDNRNLARMAGLLGGLPVEVAGATINRLCGSGMEAISLAARAIQAGEGDLKIAGGAESMSRAPFVMPKANVPFSRQAEIYDTTLGWRFINKKMHEAYGTDSMPETAENLAEERGITRGDQDAFAARSQARAAAAQESGRFDEEIIPVTIPARRGDPVVVSADEHPRAGTTAEKLAKLPTPFRDGGTVTAGNASGVNDGAAALILASEEAAARNGLTPLARVVGCAVAGVPPRIMGIGPAPATLKLLARTGLGLNDMAVIELNEAFAAQYLACEKALELDRSKVLIYM
ncbi:MAG: acetyl-CoA C-acyltransferase [Proteobacteria bacterium]|nr:acetyl-CoA C-acyltransferase [Pseudomonadota bacterium]